MGDQEPDAPDPSDPARPAAAGANGRAAAEEEGPSAGTGGRAAPGNPETLDVTREELRTTFQYQVERLREIDSKAIEILKANLLLIGIVVTGGSILTQTELDVGLFLNPFTVIGGLLLLVSTGLASVTYTSSNLSGGISTDAVEAAIAERRAGPPTPPVPADGGGGASLDTEAPFEERLVRSYARWIDYNARMTAVNDMLVTVTVLSVFVAFVYVAVGVIVAAVGLSTAASWIVFGVLSVLCGAFIRVTYHMDHLGAAEERRGETFRGVKLSKGTTRRRGLRTLREMVGWSSPEDDDERDENR